MNEWPQSIDDLLPILMNRMELLEHNVWELQARLRAGESRLNRMERVEPIVGHSTALAYTKQWNAAHPDNQVVEHVDAMMRLGRLAAPEGRRRGFPVHKKSAVTGVAANVWPNVVWEAVWDRFFREAKLRGWVVTRGQTQMACAICAKTGVRLTYSTRGLICDTCTWKFMNATG